MIYLKLFYNFFIVGFFSFGGAYSAIPLVKDAARNFDVITETMLEDFIAIAESTPGPVAVNLATFVGTKVAGLSGAIVATIAEVLPAFIIILLFVFYLKKYIENRHVAFVLSVIRPSVIGIIMSVGIYMFINNLKLQSLKYTANFSILQIKPFIVAILLIFLIYVYKLVTKKNLSSILIIVFGAIFGIAINYLL